MTIESLLASLTNGASAYNDPGAAQPPSEDEMAALLADNDVQLEELMKELQKRVGQEGGVGASGVPGGGLGHDPSHMLKTSNSGPPPMNEIVPEPGFVVKTKNTVKVEDWPAELKVFINICHSAQVPAPPLATNEEIQAALNAEDNAAYKVPLSLSSPKPDRDKTGKMCLVFDACVNTDPLNKAQTDFDFKLFLIILALEWVEEKYKLTLSRDFTLPKMTAKGKLSKHIIRRPKRPVIAEVPPGSVATLAKPEHDITCEPSQGPPDYVIVQIQLPGVATVKGSALDIEAQRLILDVPGHYHLDIALPAKIDTEDAGAQFDRGSRTLTVTLKC
ncbi:PIH1 domain-containing protein 1 [Thoreauomyces humboldtii]|nr:PIH1 domain-containing protein 1 [Thoreauomyces humboldtii]